MDEQNSLSRAESFIKHESKNKAGVCRAAALIWTRTFRSTEPSEPEGPEDEEEELHLHHGSVDQSLEHFIQFLCFYEICSLVTLFVCLLLLISHSSLYRTSCFSCFLFDSKLFFHFLQLYLLHLLHLLFLISL